MITTKSLGKDGELGNQLFQISAVIGTATKHGVGFNFPKWDCIYSKINYSKYFKNVIPDSLNINEDFELYKEPKYTYNEIPYLPGQKLDLKGYFQTEKYFSHCKEEIKKWFEPSETVKNTINKLSYKDVVGLQLRFYDGSRCYGLPIRGNDPEYGIHWHTVEENVPYIERAINFLGKQKTYFVSSNNYKKAKQIFCKYSNFYFLDEDGFSPIEKIFILSNCEHNIITNSTFGWWGAWLNNNPDKVIFAPSKWTKSGKPMDDLYPENWKIV